jgi:hypothetical protein
VVGGAERVVVGQRPRFIFLRLYAAPKRRSSTVVLAAVVLLQFKNKSKVKAADRSVRSTRGVAPPGPKTEKGRFAATLESACYGSVYRVDSISKPQASSRGSGMYFEFLLRRAHSRRRVERRYWSGDSLYSRTTCSNSVMVGTMGPMGSGLPQFGFPRRLAMKLAFRTKGE